ncbi:hypothetical protein SAMN03097699_0787 [Flavobacteriaceae bacterium MAR_2010_188]|nr:hypothetical protein SAMN03097699_0787 [Flavobacteriaceae bacterium MAR_2010_188]
MEATVNILWLILLIVTVLVLPFLIHLLNRTWKAARSIERYFLEMKAAGIGVANNTGYIEALDDTIKVASGILGVAGSINSRSETLKSTLAKRAEDLK